MKKLLFASSSAADKFNAMLEAFGAIAGLDVVAVHRLRQTTDYYQRPLSLSTKLFEKLKIPRDAERHNSRLLKAARVMGPDAVFVVKGNHIRPSTLQKLAALPSRPVLISWSQDDMFARHNRSAYYTRGLRLFDLVVTQKSYNLDLQELPSLGARKLLFQNKAFSPLVHYRTAHHPDFSHDVLFVGTAETERFELMNALAHRGIKIHIYGSGWDKAPYRDTAHENLRINNRNLLAETYAQAISSARICLGFLRKQNRDRQTSRTVEIPACGGFMLAEASEEQAALFAPNKEAAYFSTVDEAEASIRYFLAHDAARKAIADAGYAKSRSADYSYDARAREILDTASRIRAFSIRN
ncbi:hypothetical protein MALG_02573 [Marinovum algicola DG 898]|nr:hypothetical protein MALG_02573 [Marinovum algicola DG 898]